MITAEFQQKLEELADRTTQQVLAVYESSPDDVVPLIAAVLNRADAEAVGLADLYVVAQLQELTGAPISAAGVLPTDHQDRLEKSVRTILSEPPVTQVSRVEVKQFFVDAGVDPGLFDLAAVVKYVNRTIRDARIQLSDDTDDWTAEDHREAHHEFGRVMGVDVLENAVESYAAKDADEAKLDELWGELQNDEFDDLPPLWENSPENASERLKRLARSEPLLSAQKAVHVAAKAQQSAIEKTGRYMGWIRHLNPGHCQLCKWWNRRDRIWPMEHNLVQHIGCNCQKRIVLVSKKPKPVRKRRR